MISYILCISTPFSMLATTNSHDFTIVDHMSRFIVSFNIRQIYVELEVHVIRSHTLCKGSRPFMVTCPNLTTISEWCVVKRGYKSSNQIDVCSKDIGARVQSMLSIMATDLACWLWGRKGQGDLYHHLMFTLIMNKIFIWTMRIIGKDYG